MTESYAAIGVFTVFAISACILAVSCWMVYTSIRDWIRAKHRMVDATDHMLKTQKALIEAHNRLNARVTAIENDLRGDAE